MADQYKKPYLDSSVFIAWIKNETIGGIDRGKIGEHILTLAEQGELSIHTSTLTLAEVHKKRSGNSLNNDEDEKILRYFEHDFIKLIDLDRRIGEQANQICRQYNLLPNDAIHLASAIRAGCDCLLTWDSKFAAVVCSQIGIEYPQIKGQLPLEP